MTIRPNSLTKGDKVAIVATARKIGLTEILSAIKLFSSWGLEVVVGDTIMKEENQFAGSDDERAADFQKYLDDKDIKAIFCARGGYGTVRIIDKLNFDKFMENPKWIVGYSDPTVLLMHLYYKYNVESIHGIMPINVKDKEFKSDAAVSLRECLFTEPLEGVYEPTKLNREGEAEGEWVGGNLSIVYSMLGSESFGDTKGKILFIEDLDEYLYHIDRTMLCLKRAGKLKDLSALVVGSFTDIHDNTVPFGKTAQEIIFDAVKEYSYPVVFNIPSGHIDDKNVARVNGRITKVIATSDKVIIKQ